MRKTSPTHRTRRTHPIRRQHPVIREARRIGVLAFAGWLVASMVLALMVAAIAPAELRPSAATLSQERLAARLTGDPVLGAELSSWWLGDGSDLLDGAATSRPVPVVAPPTPVSAPSPPARLAMLPSDSSLHTGMTLPILYYHKPPADLDAQLTYLDAHGYQVISMDAALAGLANHSLPSRAVAMTFDDGFADQMSALPILQRHHAPATFYIINGSAGSNWCIGANRRYNDPAQPPGGCGDAYLTWNQIRALDATGLVTIGGHTLDHPNLVTLSASEQYREIYDSKVEIEQQLGHPIYHFAYPYGSFNATTIQAVQRAGFLSAVSTIDSTNQSFAGRYALERIRNAFNLPY
ncbi:MAG TPA: polysaccharide deacetylase family protein [Candidatus Saccharimonadia bacterium]